MLAVLGCRQASPPAQQTSSSSFVPAGVRDAALARAAVWRNPPVAIERARLGINPPGFLRDDDEVTCTLVRAPATGTTPKFHCRTPQGVDLKIKYGAANPELPAEVAATRLLAALG